MAIQQTDRREERRAFIHGLLVQVAGRELDVEVAMRQYDEREGWSMRNSRTGHLPRFANRKGD